MASGNEEVLSVIDALKIKINVSPILPTRCDEKFRLHGTRR